MGLRWLSLIMLFNTKTSKELSANPWRLHIGIFRAPLLMISYSLTIVSVSKRYQAFPRSHLNAEDRRCPLEGKACTF
jgi:hypothetical protein